MPHYLLGWANVTELVRELFTEQEYQTRAASKNISVEVGVVRAEHARPPAEGARRAGRVHPRRTYDLSTREAKAQQSQRISSQNSASHNWQVTPMRAERD